MNAPVTQPPVRIANTPVASENPRGKFINRLSCALVALVSLRTAYAAYRDRPYVFAANLALIGAGLLGMFWKGNSKPQANTSPTDAEIAEMKAQAVRDLKAAKHPRDFLSSYTIEVLDLLSVDQIFTLRKLILCHLPSDLKVSKCMQDPWLTQLKLNTPEVLAYACCDDVQQFKQGNLKTGEFIQNQSIEGLRFVESPQGLDDLRTGLLNRASTVEITRILQEAHFVFTNQILKFSDQPGQGGFTFQQRFEREITSKWNDPFRFWFIPAVPFNKLLELGLARKDFMHRIACLHIYKKLSSIDDSESSFDKWIQHNSNDALPVPKNKDRMEEWMRGQTDEYIKDAIAANLKMDQMDPTLVTILGKERITESLERLLVKPA